MDVILLLGYGPCTLFEAGLDMVIFFVSFVGICKWWWGNGAVVLVCGGRWLWGGDLNGGGKTGYWNRWRRGGVA